MRYKAISKTAEKEQVEGQQNTQAQLANKNPEDAVKPSSNNLSPSTSIDLNDAINCNQNTQHAENYKDKNFPKGFSKLFSILWEFILCTYIIS